MSRSPVPPPADRHQTVALLRSCYRVVVPSRLRATLPRRTARLRASAAVGSERLPLGGGACRRLATTARERTQPFLAAILVSRDPYRAKTKKPPSALALPGLT